MVDTLYDCAKFRYECGNYSEASEYLYFYVILVSLLECSSFTLMFDDGSGGVHGSEVPL